MVIDIIDRYYQIFDAPSYKKYKKQLIPFATKFFKSLNSSQIDILKQGLQQLSQHYGSNLFACSYTTELIIFDSKEEYLDYYQEKLIEYDNLSKSMQRKHCLM